MRAFITGIGGFVGPHLARHLLACGDVVAGSTKSSNAFRLAVRPPGTSAPGARASRADASLAGAKEERDATAELPAASWDLMAPPSAGFVDFLHDFAPTVIYHLAAFSLPVGKFDREGAATTWRINVDATAALARIAAQCPARPRLVFISTSHVYAAPADASARVDERAPVAPVNDYGRTKLAAEEAIEREIRESGLDAVIVRAFKHVGPGQSADFMLPQWARQFATGGDEPVRVRNLDSWFDVTDVRDVVRAYRRLAECAASGDVVNVGSGVARRSGELFDELRRIAGAERKFEEEAPGTRREAIADIGKLRALTRWAPEIPWRQSVADVWREWSGR